MKCFSNKMISNSLFVALLVACSFSSVYSQKSENSEYALAVLKEDKNSKKYTRFYIQYTDTLVDNMFELLELEVQHVGKNALAMVKTMNYMSTNGFELVASNVHEDHNYFYHTLTFRRETEE